MRGSLSRQLLAWQLVIIAVLLLSIGVFSVAQSGAAFRATEGRRMLSVAEDLAANDAVRVSVADPFRHDALPTLAESTRTLSGADHVIISDPNGIVLTSPDPSQRGLPMPMGASTARSGHAWVGDVDDEGESALVAHVPIIGDDGRMVGIVAAGREMPNFFQGALHTPQNPLGLLAFATVLGVAGSVLLARRVKRQTLGLEPQEITKLVKHREALLHGIREGVLGVDQQHRITLINDQARSLLSLPQECVGARIDDLDLNERARDLLTGRTGGVNQIILRRGRVVVLNRMPISAVGAVVTMRDRTELVDLQRELAANQDATDTLRAQAHEFTNRLHTISGLIELGEYDELQRYVARVNHTREQWQNDVGSRVRDPATAALLIAKASLAAERNVGLRLHERSSLGEIDDQLSADLVTVLGNLVDNALDALEGTPAEAPAQHWIEVDVRHGEVPPEGTADGRTGDDEEEPRPPRDEVTVVVRDSGPGIAPEIAEEVFGNGFTTKAALGGRRGLGLALTRQICRQRGGSVQVRNAHGAVFTAHLPVDPTGGERAPVYGVNS